MALETDTEITPQLGGREYNTIGDKDDYDYRWFTVVMNTDNVPLIGNEDKGGWLAALATITTGTSAVDLWCTQ